MLAFGPNKAGPSHPLALAWPSEPVGRLRVAAAFASEAGARVLESLLPPAGFSAARKLWLVGIENGLTQPEALTFLAALPNSEVRVPGGRASLTSGALRAPSFFHPKLYVADVAGGITLTSASANLTQGGLENNVEQYLTWSGANTDPSARTFDQWWRKTWRAADSVDSQFIAEYAAVRPRVQPPVRPAAPVGPVLEAEPAPSDIKEANSLWIEALRPLEGGSNNQLELMLTAHHFFYPSGEPSRAEPKQLEFVDRAGHVYTNPERVVHYNGPPLMARGNAMWRVRLPTAHEGLTGYQTGGVVIRFARTEQADRYSIEVAPVGSPTAHEWEQQARKVSKVPGPPERRIGWT
jgi:HKD family nuclease